MNNINQIKQRSGAKKFASVLGKSTINPSSDEYRVIEQFTETLLATGYGVIHGGYLGGAMSAVSDTANEYITKHNLSTCLNIGVPQVQHDGLWPRVKEAEFTEVAQDIYTRLKLVASGDIAIVCPLGGDGTELEETIIFHENVVATGINKHGHQAKITPLIFFQTKNGTDWKSLIDAKIKILATSANDTSGYPWLYFVNSLEEFTTVIKRLNN